MEHHRLRGYRLLTKTLRRECQVVNHKRVLRLIRTIADLVRCNLLQT